MIPFTSLIQKICSFEQHVRDRHNTIAEAIHEVIAIKAIPTDQIFGVGTEGAAVMTGMN